MHDPMPVLIVGDPNDLYAPLQPGDPLLDIADNTLIVVGAPCLRQGWRGGVGGQAFTACSLCGESMPSTAGPHPRSGWQLVPCIAMAVNGGVAWRRADPSDFTTTSSGPPAHETTGAP